MKTFKFIPEGWNEEEKKISSINEAKDYIDTKEILQGKVESYDENYNLHINLGNGFKGIIPKAEVENTKDGQDIDTKLCVGKLNKYVQFKVEGIENKDTLLLSRKAVQEEVINSIQRDLEIGQVLTGIVKNIKPYGAFIEIGGGVVGLAHIEDLSIARIKTPYERLKIGQKINVVVKSIDKASGKINLSYKEILGTWEENIQKFNQGMNVKGIVRETEKNKNGIFIELTPNLVGMAEYSEGLEYGQEVNVYIKKIDKDKRKVKLSINNKKKKSKEKNIK